ncbi:MAG: hypothetical protein HOP30_02750 [Cyclobacteriaceae bacterium]|nr:hypothetical protein [Cyclobacteriaceae bacterium]
MKLIPYYKRTVPSRLLNQQVLSKLMQLLKEHSTHSFPEEEGYLHGHVENEQFTLTRTGKFRRVPFTVVAKGKSDGEGKWEITFTTNASGLIVLSFFVAISVYYKTLFFTPILLISYVTGINLFNKEARALEQIVEDILN